MSRHSLRFRILLLTLGVEVVTLVTFGAIAYHRSRAQLLDTLDNLLRNETETLASLLETDSNGRFALPPERMSALHHFTEFPRHDLYQVTFDDWRIIAKSPRLGDDRLAVPPQIADRLKPGKGRCYSFEWDGKSYRGRLLKVKKKVADGTAAPGANRGRPPRVKERTIFILYAEPTEDFKERLADVLEYMFYIGAAILLLSAVALWLLARLGLLPLIRLSREVATIGPDNLEYRIATEQLPKDLRSLADAINGFIKRLEKAFSRERQFAADVAHELCTPVALLKSNIQAALLAPRDPVADRKSLEELLADTERLERLTDSLLTLAEAESGVAEKTNREEIEVRSYLGSILARFEQAASQRGITLHIKESEGCKIWAESTALERILANIIDNAIKHNREGGNVWLSVGRDGNDCEIAIEDDGPGIPEDEVPHLFERFYRVDKSRSRRRGGAGLGLAIVKSLCTTQGASIRYEARDGGGSRFIVRFPIVA